MNYFKPYLAGLAYMLFVIISIGLVGFLPRHIAFVFMSAMAFAAPPAMLFYFRKEIVIKSDKERERYNLGRFSTLAAAVIVFIVAIIETVKYYG